jgi:hypothetical protein
MTDEFFTTPTGRHARKGWVEIEKQATITFPADYVVPEFADFSASGTVIAERESEHPYWVEFQRNGVWYSVFAKASWIEIGPPKPVVEVKRSPTKRHRRVVSIGSEP